MREVILAPLVAKLNGKDGEQRLIVDPDNGTVCVVVPLPPAVIAALDKQWDSTKKESTERDPNWRRGAINAALVELQRFLERLNKTDDQIDKELDSRAAVKKLVVTDMVS